MGYQALISEKEPGDLRFGGARMALMDIESALWGLRRHLEALTGRRLTNAVLQQAGANGGASFARAFAPDVTPATAVAALQDCIAAYQAAGFGRFQVTDVNWPIGRVCVQAEHSFEAWAYRRHNQPAAKPVCAYSAGVLVGFINALTERQDIVCVERTCQALGDEHCSFELLPAGDAEEAAVVAMDPDPFLSQQLNLLDILFDRMPMGIVIFDRDLRIRRFNPTWANFIDRYTAAAANQVAPGVSFFDLLPELEAEMRPLFERVLAGETVQMEGMPSTSGGITSYWDVVFSPLTENGEVIGVLDVVIDATERQQMLAELQQNEAHLRSMLESARGYAIYRVAVDPENPYLGQVVLVSPSIREVVGIETPYDFTSWFEDIHPDDLERITAANRQAMLEGVPFDETMRFWHHEKEEWRWVHTVSNPVFDRQGNVAYFNGITIDVTDQKRAEAALAEVNVTLEQKVAERTQELSTLLAASHNVASTLELEPLLGQVLDQLNSVVPFDGASILELDGEDLRLLAYRGPIPAAEAAKIRFPLEEAGANREVIRRQQAVIVPDVYADTPLARAFRETAAHQLQTTFSYVRSWMGAPLIARGQVLGMLSLDHGQAGFYDEQLAGLVQAFANQVAVFIDNGRLYTETRRAADEARTLFNVQQAISRRLDTDAVLQIIADEARRLTDTGMGAVYLLDGDELEITVVSGEVDPAMVGYRLPVDGSVAGLVVRSQRPFLVPDADAEERVHRDIVQQVGAKSFVIVPLLSGDRAIGTITVANKHGGALGPDDERILTMMAVGAVIALENARSYEAEQSRREVAEGLREILQVLNSSRPLPQVLDYIVAQAGRLMEPETAVALFSYDHEQGLAYLEAQHGLPPELAAIRYVPMAFTGADELAAQQPLVIPDAGAFAEKLYTIAAQEMPTAKTAVDVFRDSFRSYLAVPLMVRDQVYGGMAFHYRQRHQFSPEEINLALTLGDHAALAIENARLYRQEQARREEAERRRQIAEGLRDILAILNTNLPLPHTLTHVIRQACQLLGADAAMIAKLDQEQGRIFIEAMVGIPPAMAACTELPLIDSAANRASLHRQPYIANDLGRLLRERATEVAGLDAETQEWLQERQKSFNAFLSVPLVVEEEVFGDITLYYKEAQVFAAETIDLAVTFGNQAALAIENARLRAQSEQAAVAAERNRLARELHDAVTQTLFSASLIADVLPRIWERDPEMGQARLAELRELTRGALAEMRTLLLELRPATLTESSLAELLQQLVTAVIGRSRLPVELTIEGERPLSPEVQVALYRIAQESLNNIVKHAGATAVAVTLQFSDDGVQLTISDNGRGFAVADVGVHSLGLGIMRERAEKIAANLRIDSEIGAGTTIRVTV